MLGSSSDYAAAELSASSSRDDELKARRDRIMILVYAVCFVDGADVQLLPASFRALEANLGFSPSILAYLALAQAMSMAVFAPVWGSLCDGGVSPKWLLTTGVTSWGFLTILLSTVSAFWGMLVIRALIGIALASLLPITQVVIAGSTGALERGKFFGWAGSMQMCGQVLCQLVTTSISNVKFHILPGYVTDGWRVAFFSVGVLSLALGFVLASYMEDLPRQERQRGTSMNSITEFFSHMFERFGVYTNKWTFRLIVIQGLFGSVPWSALNFSVMYFQYLGYKDYLAATLATFWLASTALGNLIGGYVGDTLESYSKYHGRPLTGQLTVFSGIPLIFIIFVVLPANDKHFWLYALMLAIMGLTSSWALAGVKRPMLAQIISSRDWASVLALDTALEGASAALFGAPVVGWLAENVFDYHETSGQVSEMSKDVILRNQLALDKAILWTTIIPWTVCFFVWSLLHITYKADVKAIEALDDGEEGEVSASPESEDLPLLGKDDGCLSSDV